MVGSGRRSGFLLGRSIFGWICKSLGGVRKRWWCAKSISTFFGWLGSEPSSDHCCGINMANNAATMCTMAASSKRTQVDGVHPPPRKMKSIKISLGDAPLPRNSVHHKNFCLLRANPYNIFTGIHERGDVSQKNHLSPQPTQKRHMFSIWVFP